MAKNPLTKRSFLFIALLLAFFSRQAQSIPFQEVKVPGYDTREAFRVFLPPHMDGQKKYPLVIGLHGYPSFAAVHGFYFGLPSASQKYGFILALPSGSVDPHGDHFWNANSVCCDYYHSGVDDVGYLLSVTDHLKNLYPVDSEKVILVGHSNGGFMSYRLACDHADIFGTVVSLAGLPPLDKSQCIPSRPIRVIQIHGTEDARVPYNGYPSIIPSAQETAERFAEIDKCQNKHVGPNYDFVTNDELSGDETSTQIWDHCDAGVSVELWTIHGGVHAPSFDFLHRTFTKTIFDKLLK